MFTDQAQLVLYVTDVKKAADFWQSIGFEVLSIEEMDGSLVAEISPCSNSALTFSLYDRQFVEEHAQQVNTNAPQIMFFAQEIVQLYQKMQEQQIEVGQLMQLEEDRFIFNFVDLEGNYFAVTGN
nr:VOC family protein [Enterococcus cecorum]